MRTSRETRFELSWRRLLALAVLPVTLLLAGCYDVETTFELRADGQIELVGEVQFDPEAQHVFAAIEAYATLDPRAAPFLSRGVCRAIEIAGAMNPMMSVPVRATEGMQTTENGERYTCRFTANLGDADRFVDQLARMPAPPEAGDVVTFTKVSDRTYRLVVDLEAIPATTDDLALDAIIAGLAIQTGQAPSRADVEAFIDKTERASIAITQMLYRGRTVALTVRAPSITASTPPATNGELRLEATATEFTALTLRAEARRGKRLDVTLGY